jgi:murein tripeptide amidase MpaA
MDFNRYFTNDELASLLEEWAAAYPHILALSELGRSQEGQAIHLLTITNTGTGADTDKPAVWLDANIHATEIAGTTTALRVAWELLSQYGTDEKISRLVNTSAFYIVPRLNPDGAAWAMAEAPKFVRSGTRPYPYEDKAAGLHAEDIDRDGRILSMRLKDPHGDWKISTVNPKLMEKRAPDETGGEYYRVIPEGLIEEWDGWLLNMARAHHGLDFNRNYPFDWRPEAGQRGAGPYPASEPEIRAHVDFVTRHPNISAAIAYHTYSGIILRPYGTKADTDMDTGDLWVFEAIGERAKALTGYRTVSVFHDFKYHPKEVITGPSNDWLYDHLGIFGYVIELWDIVGRATDKYDRKPIDWMRLHPHEDDVKIYEWAKANGPADGYVDWYEYEHPQLGRVELGGWNNMYTWRNPPPHFMGEEAERNVGYVLALGEMLPRLSVLSLTAQPLEEGVHAINLVVENTGFLPTYTSNQGKKQGARPVWVEAELPEGAQFIQGKHRTELGHLEGRSNKLSISPFFSPGVDNRARAEWVVRAPAGSLIHFNIRSDRAGNLRVTKVV